MNSSFLNVNNEYSIYVPTANLNYKYAQNVTADYIDLYEVPQLTAGNSYTYIRVFYDRPGLIDYRVNNYGQYQQTITLKPVNVSDDFFARNDSMPIVVCVFSIVLLFTFIFNNLTELFKRGGLIHI